MYTDPTGHWRDVAEGVYAQKHWDSDDFERADELSRFWMIKNNEIKENYTVGSPQYAEAVALRNGYTAELNEIRSEYIAGPSLPSKNTASTPTATPVTTPTATPNEASKSQNGIINTIDNVVNWITETDQKRQDWLEEMDYKDTVKTAEMHAGLKCAISGVEKDTPEYYKILNEEIKIEESRKELASIVVSFIGAKSGKTGKTGYGEFVPREGIIEVNGKTYKYSNAGIEAVPKAGSKGLPDDAIVVRGGESKAGDLIKNQEKGSDGTLSANGGTGLSEAELSKGLPQNKISTTTVGELRTKGYDVISSPTANNPNHVSIVTPGGKVLTDIEAANLQSTFTIKPNPSK